jgi:hypothetical protein
MMQEINTYTRGYQGIRYNGIGETPPYNLFGKTPFQPPYQIREPGLPIQIRDPEMPVVGQPTKTYIWC